MARRPRPQKPPDPSPWNRFFRDEAFGVRRAAALWLLAAVIGLVVGVAVLGFRLAIQEIERFAFGAMDERIVTAAGQLQAWRVFLTPILAGAAIAPLLWLGSKIGWGDEPRASGAADVVAAGLRKPNPDDPGRLSLKDGLLSALIATISLGGGASTGREGPAVHLGATLAASVTRLLKLPRERFRTLLGCGAAAAVAASFNAPLAGVLFAHEVVLRRFRLTETGPAAVAAVAATLAVQQRFGVSTVFTPPALDPAPLVFFIAVPVFGVAAGLLAIAFSRAAFEAPARGLEVARALRIPVWCLPMLGGAAVGALALAFPQVLGVGYEATQAALIGAYGWAFLLILVLAKGLATIISLGARFGGGVVSPSLYLGAAFGGAFGAGVGMIAGRQELGEAFFAIVGMGAVSGAVLGAPISTTVLVFELTRSYETAAAVLVATSLATVLMIAVLGGSVFDLQRQAMQKAPPSRLSGLRRRLHEQHQKKPRH